MKTSEQQVQQEQQEQQEAVQDLQTVREGISAVNPDKIDEYYQKLQNTQYCSGQKEDMLHAKVLNAVKIGAVILAAAIVLAVISVYVFKLMVIHFSLGTAVTIALGAAAVVSAGIVTSFQHG